MAWIIVVLGVILFSYIINLQKRVGRLEKLITESKFQIQNEENLNYQTGFQAELDPNIQQSPFIPPNTNLDTPNKLLAWLKDDWILKLGALLLLIGFGWLTTYAFLNNWIGPMGRITLGIFAGTLLLILGWWRIKKYINQGAIFLVLGSSTILLTIFAARVFYDFFTPLSALFVMLMSIAFVAYISVKHNSRTLSLLSLIIASIAPLLTNPPDSNLIVLFSYLFIVILGATWIVTITGDRKLTVVSLIIISLYSLPHILIPFVSAKMFPLVDIQKLLLFAYAFSALFFVSNIIEIIKSKEKAITHNLFTTIGVGVFLLLWIMAAGNDEWKSLIIIAWMIVFAVGGYIVFRIREEKELFYSYLAVCILLLSVATSLELKGATLVIAYAIESTFIILFVDKFIKESHIVEKVSLLFIGPVIMSFGSISSYAWRMGMWHKEFFVLLIMGLIFLGLGLFFKQRAKETNDNKLQQLNFIFLVTGSLYFYLLLWLSLHATIANSNTAVMISLIIYTIVGLSFYLSGLKNDKKIVRLYGGILVLFVVGRLLLIDVWSMELIGKIITFFLIGALFVSTAFLGKKNKEINNNNI